MKILQNPSPTEWLDATKRPSRSDPERSHAVKVILAEVKTGGDQAISKFSEQFDRVRPNSLSVLDDESRAGETISEALKTAIRASIRNVRCYHNAQAPKEYSLSTEPGLLCQRLFRPIEKVGLYVPGGNTPLISTLIMLAIPALQAGCETIVVCTPPKSDGTVDPAILFAARELGITQIYKVGGAQAIAAMAYGTETIPAVYKIFGPGNAFVATAKSLVAQEGIAIDLPAGPSEVLVVADETANPAFIAADLLSQAEHGPDSQVGLITWDQTLSKKVKAALEEQLAQLPRRAIAEQSIAQSFLVTVDTPEQAIALANDYASEHLILACSAPERFVPQIKNAGSIFLGNWSSESFGDYAAGPNHVLPTNKAARAFSGVSVESFGKYISVQKANQRAVQALGSHVVTLAEAEQLEAHANAVRLRLKALENSVELERSASVIRQTKETNCRVAINLDGTGQNHITTGIGFFDHMLQQIAVHGLIDLFVNVTGDTQIDEHHTIEDTGLALGDAILQALGDKKAMRRYGFVLPMDETRAEVLIDFSGRAQFNWNAEFTREKVGDFPLEMASHFFKSFSDNAKCTLHITATGENDHHIIEGIFKAFAKALRMATEKDERNAGIPSSKGSL